MLSRTIRRRTGCSAGAGGHPTHSSSGTRTPVRNLRVGGREPAASPACLTLDQRGHHECHAWLASMAVDGDVVDDPLVFPGIGDVAAVVAVVGSGHPTGLHPLSI